MERNRRVFYGVETSLDQLNKWLKILSFRNEDVFCSSSIDLSFKKREAHIGAKEPSVSLEVNILASRAQGVTFIKKYKKFIEKTCYAQISHIFPSLQQLDTITPVIKSKNGCKTV